MYKEDSFRGNEAVADQLDSEKETLQEQYKFISKLITAISNFSVQYNFQAIAIALIVMSQSVCTSNDDACKDGDQDEWVKSTASAAVFIGAILGQLTMGYVGDLFGRNGAMMLTLSIVVVSALVSASPTGSATTIYSVITVARFFLGVGVGGVYPLSATKAAEDSRHGGKQSVNVKAAGRAFFWQTPGAMAPWMMGLILAKSDISPDTKWRLLLGLGALPAAVVVALSLWEMQVKRRIESYETNNERLKHNRQRQHRVSKDNALIWQMLHERRTWIDLAATGGGWFIYDIAFYGVNLFGGEILAKINNTDDDSVSSDSHVYTVSGQELIGLSLGIPACILAIYTIRPLTTKTLQVFGFLLIAFAFTLLAACFVPLRDSNPDGLFAMYCFLLFTLNYGPNLTTYVLPAETYPKEVRATFNGISAACGKLGAFMGVYMFGGLSTVVSYPVIMAICAGFSVLGAILSYWAIENKATDEPGADDDDAVSTYSRDTSGNLEQSLLHSTKWNEGA